MLFDLWVQFYEKLDSAERYLLPLRKVYYLSPPE